MECLHTGSVLLVASPIFCQGESTGRALGGDKSRILHVWKTKAFIFSATSRFAQAPITDSSPCIAARSIRVNRMIFVSPQEKRVRILPTLCVPSVFFRKQNRCG